MRAGAFLPSSEPTFAAFVSSATNISTDNILAHPQVYVRDTCAGPTATKSCVAHTISVALDDEDRLSSIQSGRPAISADGHFVVYEAWSAASATSSAGAAFGIAIADFGARSIVKPLIRRLLFPAARGYAFVCNPRE